MVHPAPAATSFLSTPSARRATKSRFYREVETIFLSTPSARRATQLVFLVDKGKAISIHALREEGDLDVLFAAQQVEVISIHALREEGDPVVLRVRLRHSVFLSTPSARRATGRHGNFLCAQLISIHALREEGDGA